MKILITVLFLTLGGNLYATEITDEKAIRAIIGEAENQGADGMRAVAHAIRNRGHLGGVYGSRSARYRLCSRATRRQAEDAWKRSGYERDITNGAQYWGTEADIKKFKKERWFSRVEKTITLKDHSFFKEIK